ncbi:hypothetical protein, partial [Klebsiella pneumoniae]|uniref:hypothetical protein n=1 Tax=Klebsiella pneumoniae TaxID=573 RepID=UPI001C70162A
LFFSALPDKPPAENSLSYRLLFFAFLRACLLIPSSDIIAPAATLTEISQYFILSGNNLHQ